MESNGNSERPIESGPEILAPIDDSYQAFDCSDRQDGQVKFPETADEEQQRINDWLRKKYRDNS